MVYRQRSSAVFRSTLFLGAVVAALSPVGRADAFAQRHLYVAVEQLGFDGSSGGTPYILRYPVNGWRLGSKPDLTYTGYGAPLAFDSRGNLFAGMGSLSQFKTGSLSVFHPNVVTPFTSFGIPDAGWASYITGAAVSARGYVTIGYTRFADISSVPVPWIATLRISDKKVLNETQLSTFESDQPVNGLLFDDSDQLYVSFGDSVHVYGGLGEHKIQELGFLRNKVMRTPGGLASSSSGKLFVVDLPPKRKASVSSYPLEARGNIRPQRVLIPVLGEKPSWCCAYGGPFVLRYQTSIIQARLYLPFLRMAPTGDMVTGVYEFNVSQDGVSTPIASLITTKSPASQSPYVAAAALIGP